MKNIFISSTFRDMQAERDMVQERVLPALREEARKYGDNVGVIDLRWGVDTSTLETEEGAAKVLKVCLDEIDRSHPYMLIFLGERYGWIPEGELIERAVRGREDKYVTKDYTKSVTALEIEYGALSEKYGELNHCVVCFREPVVSMLDGEEKAVYEETTEEGKRKLEALKERIKCDLGNEGRLITYSGTWDKSARQLVNFISNGQPLEAVLTNCFTEMFRDDWKEYENLSWQDKEQLAFRALMESKLRSFVGREALLEEYYQSAVNGTCPIILQGEVGSGKTAIMCKLVERLQKEGKNVFAFFAGAGSMSTNAESLVKQMVYYMENLLGVEEHFGEEDALNKMEEGLEKRTLRYSDWIDRLRELCYRLPEEKKAYFCIDALDQLYLDEHVEKLDFFVKGKYVQIIASCTDTFNLSMNVMEHREVKAIPALNETDAKEVAESILASYSRNAYEAIENEILKKKSIGSPLYISLLIQRLNMMDAEELRKAMTEEEIVALGTKIVREMPDTLEDATVSIIQNGIAKVSDNADMLKETLGYLAVSRNGLRMQDLQGIFSMKNQDFSILDVTLLLSYLDTFFYLDEDGRMDFTHKVIRGGLLKEIANKKHYEEGIKNYLLAIGIEDELTIKEGLYYAHIFEEYAFAQRLIACGGNAATKELRRSIKEEALADGGEFLVSVLGLEGGYRSKSIAFFLNMHHAIFETSKKEREVKLFIGEALLDICERAYERNKNEEALVNLADCLLFVGKEKKIAGEPEEAVKFFDRAMGYCEQIQEKNDSQKNALRLMDAYVGGANLVSGSVREEEILARASLRMNEFQKYSSINIRNGIATFFVNMGMRSMRKGEYRSAQRCLEQAMQYRQELLKVLDTETTRQSIYSVYEKMGLLFREMGQLEKAKESLSEGIKGLEEEYSKNPSIRNLRLLQNGYLNMSYVTMAAEALEIEKKQSRLVLMKALECAEKLYEIEESITSLKELAMACHNLATLCITEDDVGDQCLQYCERARKYAELLYNAAPGKEVEEMLVSVYQLNSSVYGMLDRPEEQKECFEKAEYFAKKNQGQMTGKVAGMNLVGVYMIKAQDEFEEGNMKEAIEYGRKVIECIENGKSGPLDAKELYALILSYAVISDASEALGEETEAGGATEKWIECCKEMKTRFPELSKQFGVDAMLRQAEEEDDLDEEAIRDLKSRIEDLKVIVLFGVSGVFESKEYETFYKKVEETGMEYKILSREELETIFSDEKYSKLVEYSDDVNGVIFGEDAGGVVDLWKYFEQDKDILVKGALIDGVYYQKELMGVMGAIASLDETNRMFLSLMVKKLADAGMTMDMISKAMVTYIQKVKSGKWSVSEVKKDGTEENGAGESRMTLQKEERNEEMMSSNESNVEMQEKNRQEIYLPIREIEEAFSKIGVKYTVERLEDKCVLSVKCGSDNGMVYVMRFISYGENSLKFRIFNFVKNVPEKKSGEILKLVNDCNRRYIMFKFILDNDNDVVLHYDVSVDVKSYALVGIELFTKARKILEDCYPQFMKAIWS